MHLVFDSLCRLKHFLQNFKDHPAQMCLVEENSSIPKYTCIPRKKIRITF